MAFNEHLFVLLLLNIFLACNPVNGLTHEEQVGMHDVSYQVYEHCHSNPSRQFGTGNKTRTSAT